MMLRSLPYKYRHHLYLSLCVVKLALPLQITFWSLSVVQEVRVHYTGCRIGSVVGRFKVRKAYVSTVIDKIAIEVELVTAGIVSVSHLACRLHVKVTEEVDGRFAPLPYYRQSARYLC